MNTCGTCKFRGAEFKNFNSETFDNDIPTGYFMCERARHADDYGDSKVKKGDSAVVIDGSGYYAALCVETDFGCNKWEQKP